MLNSREKNILESKIKQTAYPVKTLFFVANGIAIKKLEMLIKENSNNDLLIISLDVYIQKELAVKNIESKCISDYCDGNFWEKVGKSSVDWIKNWSDQRIINGKSIKEELIYQDCSLWWFLKDVLFATKGGILDTFFYIEIFFSIIEKENPQNIYFIGLDDNRFYLIKNIVNQLGVNFFYKEVKKNKVDKFYILNFVKIKKYYNKALKFLNRTLVIIYRKIAFLIYIIRNLFIKKNNKSFKKVLLFPHHAAYARHYWVDDKKYVGDFYYRGIEEALMQDKNLKVLSLSPDVPFLNKSSYFLDFFEIIKGHSYRPVEGYIDLSIYIKKIWHRFNFKKKLTKIINTPLFKGNFVYRNINFYFFIENHFEGLFMQSLSSAIGLLDVADNIIKRENPDIIVTIYETSTDKRALEIVAKRRNIPVIGFMHGLISSFEPSRISYIHKEGETWYGKNDHITNCPIPLKTLVYGDYYKNLLVNDGYPKHTVIVTGCARFDYLLGGDKKHFDQNCREMGVDLNKKTILFISEGLCDDYMFQKIQKDNEKNIETVRKILKTSPNNIQLIIKVHPRDNEKNYINLYREFPKTDIKIIKYGDLVSLINCATIIIMKSSTAGMESAFFKKPIINLNLFNEPDFASYYVNEGVALKAYDENSLRAAINDLLDGAVKEKLVNNSDKFIEKLAYKIDGNSSLRVKQAILDELK